MTFKPGQLLHLKLLSDRQKATKGRDKLTVKSSPGPQGWVKIQYIDGTDDFLTDDILRRFWSASLGAHTKLWGIMND